MIRAEKRRLIKGYNKQLEYIRKHTPYLEFKTSGEFMLPQEEIGKLMDGVHEDISLQQRFDIAKDLFARVDALNTLIGRLQKPNTEEHQSSSTEHTRGLSK